MAVDNHALSIVQQFVPGIVDFAVEKSVLLKELKARGRIKYKQAMDTGLDMTWYGTNGMLNAVCSPGDYMGVQATQNDGGQRATATLSSLFIAYPWSEQQRRRLLNYPTKLEYYNYFATKTAEAKYALTRNLIQDLAWDGNQTRTNTISTDNTRIMVGLQQIVNATNTLYGINRTTYTAFGSTTNTVTAFATQDANGQPEGIRKMQILSRTLNLVGKKAVGPTVAEEPAEIAEGWDFIYCHPTAEQLYLDSQASRLRGGLSDGSNDLGQQGATAFDKKPVHTDNFCTFRGSAHFPMYFLNAGHLQLNVIDASLFDTYATDDTGLVKDMTVGGQHCLFSDKPSTHGLLDITA